MKNSDIKINVILDDQNVPEALNWSAADTGNQTQPAKAVNVSIWDHVNRETLKMDLWTKDMSIDEMKVFYVDIIGSMAESLRQSTGDAELAKHLDDAGKAMMKQLEKGYK